MSDLIRFCAIEDTLDARDTRWQDSIVEAGIRWALADDAALPAFTRAVLLDHARKAFSRISEVCRPHFVESAPGNAHILMTTGKIDGPGGTLAWSNLPPSNPCEQKYDTGERWNQSVNLLAVMLHELAHAMGLQHDPQRGALMSAYYDPAIQDYTSRDVARLVSLYGQPRPKPTPPVPTPAPGDGVVITVKAWHCEHVLVETPTEAGLTVIRFVRPALMEVPGYKVSRIP